MIQKQILPNYKLNREGFVAMCTLESKENTNSFYEPHLVLQNISESIDKKEAGKIRAEFPPDLLSALAAFRSRSLDGKYLHYSTDNKLPKLKNFLILPDRICNLPPQRLVN